MPHDREVTAAVVLSGLLPLKVDGRRYSLRAPTPPERLAAALAARDAYDDAVLAGLFTDGEHERFLRSRWLWSDAEQNELDQLEKDAERLKIKLCELWGKDNEIANGRVLLNAARERADALRFRRATYSDLTASGHAAVAHSRCLAFQCLSGLDGKTRVWSGNDYSECRSTLLDAAVHASHVTRPREAELREVARTEPWRTAWACRQDVGGLFGKPSAELTDEQKQVVIWSRVYDNVREDQERPPEDLMADDDAFDGWLLLRKKEAEAERPAELTKAQRASSVFVVNAAPAEITGIKTPDDIARVASMNSAEALALKARRAAFLRERGSVQEAEMPDSQERIRAEWMAQHRAVGRG